jgi:hypothetical protein
MTVSQIFAENTYHLVGKREQLVRHFEAKGLCRRKVDDQFRPFEITVAAQLVIQRWAFGLGTNKVQHRHLQ